MLSPVPSLFTELCTSLCILASPHFALQYQTRPLNQKRRIAPDPAYAATHACLPLRRELPRALFTNRTLCHQTHGDSGTILCQDCQSGGWSRIPLNTGWSDTMQYRPTELVAFGPELCKEARRAGKGVNESYFLVHRVLTEVFHEDLTQIPQSSLQAHLSNRLQENLRATG